MSKRRTHSPESSPSRMEALSGPQDAPEIAADQRGAPESRWTNGRSSSWKEPVTFFPKGKKKDSRQRREPGKERPNCSANWQKLQMELEWLLTKKVTAARPFFFPDARDIAKAGPASSTNEKSHSAVSATPGANPDPHAVLTAHLPCGLNPPGIMARIDAAVILGGSNLWKPSMGSSIWPKKGSDQARDRGPKPHASRMGLRASLPETSHAPRW